MIHIVIPLIPSPWQDNELRYHLRSLQKNLKADFDVTILSDQQLPDWATNMRLIHVERFYPKGLEEKYGGYKLFENFFDTSFKLYQYCQLPDCPDEFVWAYDDQLLLNEVSDFTQFDGLVLCKENVNRLKDKRMSRHQKTIWQAIEIVRRRKTRNGVYNAELHAYKPYKRDKLLDIFERDDPTKKDIPYAINTVYRNMFCEVTNVVKESEEPIVAYTHWDDGTNHHHLPATRQEIQFIWNKYITLSYNDLGLNALGGLLRNFIQEAFPEKSKFEL